jgi:hypothetical protein
MILKKSKTKWIDVKGFDGVKVKIDYSSPEQEEDLREIMFQMIYNNPNIGRKEIEYVVLTSEQKAKENRIAEKLAKLRIRYQVKDWAGVTDDDGNDVPIKIVNNMIDKDLFDGFIGNFEYVPLISLGKVIQDETEFNESDKKKLSSEESAS